VTSTSADAPSARPAALDEPYRPPAGAPACLHADDAILVLVKPAGLLCAPGRGDDKQDCLVSRARVRWPDALLVHRLDLATSGLVLLARSALAHARLSAAFRERRVDKAYQALVHGPLAADVGEIDLPLAADWPNRPLQKVCEATGRPSLTRWRRVAGRDAMHAGDPREAHDELDPHDAPDTRDEAIARVDLEPVTGRTHQLRVHLAAICCPIVGDPLYGRDGDPAPRLMLHAAMLAFAHPATGEALRFESPAPF
jgi:tRNA pseudouridine32 synthase/23S rRNA pseudouridine746 synthase